jgi:hypothetical protein
MNARRGCLAGCAAVILGVVVLFLLIQLIPYGKNHTNPPVVAEPKWDSPQTLALAKRACFDCHSNVTIWPWYSNIAPISWLVQRDVDEGRRRLNFSEWTGQQSSGGEEGNGTGEVTRTIERGSMPPFQYILQHPTASLNQTEKADLIRGLQASLSIAP